MASHHHHHHHDSRHHNHREALPLPPTYYSTSPPCCCADSSHCCIQSNQPSPPNLDHLLRLISSYLQNQQQRETQCSCDTISPRFNAVRGPSFLVNQQQHKKKTVQQEYDNLLRKIDDLDLSLDRFYGKRRDSYSTLRDSAARVIQTHFRSYLVSRSISLRQLKELATIKSSFLSLKSSVSGKTQFPFEAVSREATDLLLQLDSIQGRVDSMIRDGKRSLSRDLVRFLQYIDDCAVKRRNIVCKSAKDLSFRGQCKGSGEKLKKQIRTIYVTSNGDKDIAELEEFHFVSDDGKGIPIVSAEKGRKVGSSASRVRAMEQGDKVKRLFTKTVKIGKHRNVYELSSSAEDDDGEEIMMMPRGDGVARGGSRSGVVIKGNGGKTRVMKTVRFDEDGNVYKVYGDTPETSVSEGDNSSTSGSNNEIGDGYNEVEDLKYVPKENEGFEEEEEEDEEESSSEGINEEQFIENVSHTGRNEDKQEFQIRKGSSMFSPPLPLKMEP